MPTQKVLDHTGHSEKVWDKADKVAVTEAEARFNELVKTQRHIAFEPGKNGEPGRQLRSFDPDVETTIFTPALQGG